MAQRNNEIYHYGIPGMKWGKRKNSREHSSDYDKVKAIRRKSIKEMSNQDLRDANNRMQLENQYRQLKSNQNAGRRAAKAFMATAGLISGVVGAAATYKKYGNNALNKIANFAVKDLKFTGLR